MKRLFLVLGLAAAAFTLGASTAEFQAAPLRGFEARLAEAVAGGRLDSGRAALYRLYALKAPERLPAEYRATPAGVAGREARGPAALGWRARCGTTLLRGIKEEISSLPEAERREAEALLAPERPRGAAPAAAAGGKTVTHALANWLVTPNFSIEWGPDLTNEDGTLPLRDDDRDNLPDVAERWAAYFEEAYREEVSSPVYNPSAVLANLVPVYLGNSDPSRSVDDIGGSTYAFTQESDPVSYIVVNNDLTFVPDNDESAPDPSTTESKIRGAMKVTAAHEFFHVIQFAQPLPSAWSPTADDWWLEASATWMEDEVFDGVNDYYQYYEGAGGWPSFAAAGLPVRSTDPDYVTRAYGAAIFAKYLSEHAGGGDSIRDVWGLVRGGQRILPALDSFARAEGFVGGLGELFVGFAAANAVMDYEEGDHYGQVPTDERTPLTAASANFSTSPPSPANPSYLGAVTLRRTGTSNGTGRNFVLGGTPSGSWGLALAVRRSGGRLLALGGTGAGGTTVTLESLGSDDSAWAGIAFLQAGGRSTAWELNDLGTPLTGTEPGAPQGLLLTTAPGGLDLTWTAPSSGSPRGYVLQWRKGSSGAFSSRALFGPVTRAELRELDGNASYEVRVTAYDPRGAEGAEASGDATTGPAPDPSVPDATVVDENVPLFLDALRPSSAGRGFSFELQVLGGGLGAADFVGVSGPSTGVSLDIDEAGYGLLRLNADIEAQALPGTYTVTVHTPTESASLPLTVVAGTLAVGPVDPPAADPGDVLSATVYGTGLDAVESAEFEDSRFSLDLDGGATFTSLPVTIQVPSDAVPGSYRFRVHSADETASGTFTVRSAGSGEDGGGGGGGGGGCFVGALGW